MVLLRQRPLPVGRPTPPAAPQLLRSSSSTWTAALLLWPVRSVRSLGTRGGENSAQSLQKPQTFFGRRLTVSALLVVLKNREGDTFK